MGSPDPYSRFNLYWFSCSDEEDVEALDWLPMAPEIEDPEEPGWGQLEVREYGGVGSVGGT